jgi:hypothetical protein
VQCTQCRGRTNNTLRCCEQCGGEVWCAECFKDRMVYFHSLCNECIEQNNNDLARLREEEELNEEE